MGRARSWSPGKYQAVSHCQWLFYVKAQNEEFDYSRQKMEDGFLSLDWREWCLPADPNTSEPLAHFYLISTDRVNTWSRPFAVNAKVCGLSAIYQPIFSSHHSSPKSFHSWRPVITYLLPTYRTTLSRGWHLLTPNFHATISSSNLPIPYTLTIPMATHPKKDSMQTVSCLIPASP